MAATLTQPPIVIGDADTSVSLGGSTSGLADSSTTVKGLVKLATAPASAGNPIAVGDNDARNTNARTPSAHTASHISGSDQLADATGSVHGLMSAIDKAKFNTLQAGSGTLSSGTVIITTATISGSSSIVVTRKTNGGTVGAQLAVPSSTRTVGAPGSSAFTVNSLDATGSLVATDSSTFDWMIFN